MDLSGQTPAIFTLKGTANGTLFIEAILAPEPPECFLEKINVLASVWSGQEPFPYYKQIFVILY